MGRVEEDDGLVWLPEIERHIFPEAAVTKLLRETLEKGEPMDEHHNEAWLGGHEQFGDAVARHVLNGPETPSQETLALLALNQTLRALVKAQQKIALTGWVTP
jgi:hypothetical protein